MSVFLESLTVRAKWGVGLLGAITLAALTGCRDRPATSDANKTIDPAAIRVADRFVRAYLGISSESPMAYLTEDAPGRPLAAAERRAFAGLSFCCERKRVRQSDKSVIYYFRGNTAIINACVHVWPVRSGHKWRVADYTYAAVSERRRERLAECFP